MDNGNAITGDSCRSNLPVILRDELQSLAKQSHVRIMNTAVQSEKGVSFRAITNFHFEKNKKMFFCMFLKNYLHCIALNHMKFYTFNKSFIIYLMM